MSRSDERGVALVIALFMTMIVSALAAGMAYVARAETLSSQSYTTMTQARYGAESGLAAATNYLLSTPYGHSRQGARPIRWRTTTGPSRRCAGRTRQSCSPPIRRILSGTTQSANVMTAFETAASGTLQIANGNVTYGARARLLALRQVTDSMSGLTETLQKWEITGWGRQGGSGSSEVEVSAIVERQVIPLYRYAAFATSHRLCRAVVFRRCHDEELQLAGPLGWKPRDPQHRRRRRQQRQPGALRQPRRPSTARCPRRAPGSGPAPPTT